MKKLISLLLTAVMILACAAAETAGSAPAQEAEPVYKTVGEALDAAGFDGMSGMMNDRYVVAGRQDGKILRSVAAVDEKYTALNNAVADADDIDAAFEALDEYARTLPILYTEEITAVPLDPAELEVLNGSTVSDLENLGFEIDFCGWSGDDRIVSFNMAKGLYNYEFIINEPPEVYDALSETGDYGTLTVNSASPAGLSRNILDLDYKADGSYEPSEDTDIFSGAFDFLQIIADAAQSGQLDKDALIGALEDATPEQEEAIRALLEMIESIGAPQQEAAGQ